LAIAAPAGPEDASPLPKKGAPGRLTITVGRPAFDIARAVLILAQHCALAIFPLLQKANRQLMRNAIPVIHEYPHG
jgi:hypothetical protein